jgi:hypothetical protein
MNNKHINILFITVAAADMKIQNVELGQHQVAGTGPVIIK